MRLEIDRWGKIQDEVKTKTSLYNLMQCQNVTISDINKTNNLSEVSYEIKVVRNAERGERGGRGGRRGGRGGSRGAPRRGRGGY